MAAQIELDSDTLSKLKRNRQPYPEKGLVASLQSVGDKLSAASGAALADDELADETLEVIRVLSEELSQILARIGDVRKGDTAFSSTRRRKSTPQS